VGPTCQTAPLSFRLPHPVRRCLRALPSSSQPLPPSSTPARSLPSLSLLDKAAFWFIACRRPTWRSWRPAAVVLSAFNGVESLLFHFFSFSDPESSASHLNRKRTDRTELSIARRYQSSCRLRALSCSCYFYKYLFAVASLILSGYLASLNLRLVFCCSFSLVDRLVNDLTILDFVTFSGKSFLQY
jgi:hypothetical protein